MATTTKIPLHKTFFFKLNTIFLKMFNEIANKTEQELLMLKNRKFLKHT